MEIYLFIKSIGIGLLIAAPVGPIGLLCMQRTLNRGMANGLASGLGAATADAVYGIIGATGFTAVIHLFSGLQKPMTIVGAIFLLWLGFSMIRQKTAIKAAATEGRSAALISAFSSTFLLTLANPITILSFIAVFAAISGDQIISSAAAVIMVTGIFLGSAIWWLILSFSVAMIRHKISESVIERISIIAGVLLAGFGLLQLGSAF